MITTEDIGSSPSLVVLFSNYSLLSRNVANKLISKGYEIIIVSTDKDNWKKHESGNFQIIEPDFLWNEIIDRVDNILLFLFSKQEIEDYAKSCEILSKGSGAKLLVVTNYSKEKDLLNYFKTGVEPIINDKQIFAGTIYLAEIFERSSIYKQIIESTVNNILTIDPKEHFFLVDREQAEEQIINKLLSLSVYGSSVTITSMPISSKTFFRNIVKYNPNLKVEYKNAEQKHNSYSEEKVVLDFDPETEIKDLIGKGKHKLLSVSDWDGVPKIELKEHQSSVVLPDVVQAGPTNPLPDEVEIEADQKNKQNFRMDLYGSFKNSIALRNKKIKLRKFSFIFTLFFLLPYLTFTISLLFIKTGSTTEAAGLSNAALVNYKVSKKIAFVSYEHIRYMSHIPVIGKPYENSLNYALLVDRSANAKINSAQAAIKLSEFFEKSLRQDQNDLDEEAQSIFLEIDRIYNDHGLIRGQLNASSGWSRSFKNFIIGKIPSEKDMNKLFSYRESLKMLPELLGKYETKHYALLLADNRIKRPGGGVVEAVAVATFDKGNLVNLVIYDTSELDKLLKGVANPPSVLSENTNINEYYLRDSLWSPHFPESADEVRWFLERQLESSIDGVLMMDLELLSLILDSTGPVRVNNETVQGVELSSRLRLGSVNPLDPDDYFKQIFTIALNRIIDMSSNEIRDMLSLISKSFDEKNALLHISDLYEKSNIVLFNSPVSAPDCGFANCANDLVSVSHIEFSRGVAVNKQMDIKISFEEGLLKRELTVYYKNQSGLTSSADFQSNLLLSIPQETSLAPVIKKTGNEQVNIEPLMLGKSWYKQAVVDTNIKPGTVKAINFRWESGYALDFSEEGQFRLRIIKQPGDEPFPLSITIEQPADYLMYNTNFDLTNDRTLHYNTQLSEDVDLMFNW